MDSYQSYWNEYDYGENLSQRQSYYDYSYYNYYNMPNYTSKENVSTKNTSRTNYDSYKKYLNNNVNTDYKKSNSNSNYNYSINNDYSYKQYTPIINQLNSNSSQYYSQKNKYLITFHSNQRKNISDNKTFSDGKLRGYSNNNTNNNCTFYVSGSSDLKSLLNNMNNKNKCNFIWEENS